MVKHDVQEERRSVGNVVRHFLGFVWKPVISAICWAVMVLKIAALSFCFRLRAGASRGDATLMLEIPRSRRFLGPGVLKLWVRVVLLSMSQTYATQYVAGPRRNRSGQQTIARNFSGMLTAGFLDLDW